MQWLFNSSFHNLEIRLLLLRDVCSVSGLKFALFYSICTTCIFLELFCKEMMCFSIENTIKNSTHFTPQNELSRHANLNAYDKQRSQYEKATYHVIPATWHSGKSKIIVIVKRSMVARGWEFRECNCWERHLGRAQRIFRTVKYSV